MLNSWNFNNLVQFMQSAFKINHQVYQVFTIIISVFTKYILLHEISVLHL